MVLLAAGITASCWGYRRQQFNERLLCAWIRWGLANPTCSALCSVFRDPQTDLLKNSAAVERAATAR